MLEPATDDICGRPLPALIAWVVPAIVVSLGVFAPLPKPWDTIFMVSGFGWMAAACAANARSCGRLHCYVTAPLFAIAAGLIAISDFGVAEIGPVVPIVLPLVAIGVVLSFAAEIRWGRYRSR